MKSDKKGNAVPIIPSYTLVIQEYFASKPSHYLDYVLHTEWKRILTEFLSEKRPSDVSQLKVEELEKCLVICEREIGNLVSKMDTYTLLFWQRRLGPHNIFKVAYATVALYRDVMTLAIFKYGKPGKPMLFNDNLFPASMLPYTDLKSEVEIKNKLTWPIVCYQLDNVIRLEILSFIYVRITQIYRWAAKGARAFLDGDTLSADAYEELEKCVELYDARLIKTNPFADLGTRFPLEKRSNGSLIALPQLNVDHQIKLPVPILSPGKKKARKSSLVHISPNYVTPSIDIPILKRFLSPYDKVIKKEHGFSVESFITFFEMLNTAKIAPLFTEIEGILEFFNRAYIPLSLSEQEPVADLINQLTGNAAADGTQYDIEELKSVARFLTSSDKHAIDLWTRRPKKIFYQVDKDFWLLDMTQMIYVITDLMTNIVSKADEMSTVRSVDFENQLKNAITRTFGKEKIWISQQRIQGRQGSGEKEIDASVVIGHTLYIIEAKAMHIPPEYDKGTPNELKKRKNKLQKALKQAKEKIKFIEDERDHLHTPANEGSKPIVLPKDIKEIKPLVVTNFPEYIWNLGENKYLDSEKKIPIFLTIDELPQLKQLKRKN